MTIQVCIGDTLVGYFNNVPTDAAEICFSTFSNHYMVDTHDIHWVQTKNKKISVSEEVIFMLQPSFFAAKQDAPSIARVKNALHVPLYAEHSILKHAKRVEFSWRVAVPTLEQYEIMFDHQDFVPV